MRTYLLVTAFLAAIAIGNLLVAEYGQIALVFTAWVVIPFDMLTRDLLHERWRDDRLALRLSGLVLAGAAISVIVSPASLRVSVASCLAFALSMGVNSLVFHALLERSRFARMNTSNLAAAIVDSIAFPALALGTIDPWLSAAQAGSKFAGGLAWTSLILWAHGRAEAKRDNNGNTSN